MTKARGCRSDVPKQQPSRARPGVNRAAQKKRAAARPQHFAFGSEFQLQRRKQQELEQIAFWQRMAHTFVNSSTPAATKNALKK